MIRRGRRKRDLKPEEKALWAHVVQHVTPLRAAPAERASDEARPAADAPKEGVPEAVTQKAATSAPPKPRAASRPAQPPPPPLATLEPKARRRLGRGADVDARLDLHGMTQTAAHHRLRMFLVDAQASGCSVVLVITGKGDAGRMDAYGADGGARSGLQRLGAMFGEERGVLRRAVPHWLAAPELRGIVLGFESAGRRHGGEGALYVRIRRRK